MVDYASESFVLFFLKVVDCRVCGDPNSVLRFAFVEFTDEGNLCFINLIANIYIYIYYSFPMLKWFLYACRRCKDCFESVRNYAWLLPSKSAAFQNGDSAC